MYTFENTCKENRDLVLNDRTCKLFFNTKAEQSSIPEDIRGLFAYIEDGIIRDKLTQDLDEEVEKLRKDEGWWSAYMKTVTWEMDARFEGIEIGRHEGIEIGRLEGGIETLVHTCQEFNATKEKAKEQLMKQFDLSSEEAEEQLLKHWR